MRALELTCGNISLLYQQCHTLLYVYNLPANKDGKSISNRLRRLSDNCGGKVLSITGCSAVLRFINQDSAERAQKRMENEDVFGNRIIVSFTPKNRELCETKASNAITDKAKSPKKLKNPKLCLIRDASEQPSSAKAMPGKGSQAHSGSATKNTNVKSLQVLLILLAFPSFWQAWFLCPCVLDACLLWCALSLFPFSMIPKGKGFLYEV